MARNPYSFPARSRRDMIAYLHEHDTYWPMNSNNGGCVLSWNVKIYNFDDAGKGELWARVNKIKPASLRKEFSPRPDRDAAWQSYIEADPEFFWHVAADAGRMYYDAEWTNYPGIEQGEWKFFSNGRSGGHLCLSECPGWVPAPRAFRCCEMTWQSKSDFQDWVTDLSTETLRKFYRAIRVLDTDLERPKVEAEVSYQVAFRRQQWEEEQDEREERDARKQEAERPDLYALTPS